MSRKKILASLIISSFALTACDSEDLPIKENENFSYSRLQFNPTGGQLPKPNDLLFSGTTDGTLQLPDEIKAVAASGAATTYADNTIGIGALDGWSTTHPLVMDVDLLDGRTIVAGAGGFLPPTAVRIFPVTLNGPLSTDAANCSTDSSVSLTVCDTSGELQYGPTGDFIAKVTDDGAGDGKGTIAVVWLNPLPAKSSFLYAFTDAIKDSSGRIIRGSKTYEFIKQNQATTPVGDTGSSTRTVQGLVNNYEQRITADYSLDASKITFSGTFTTQSTLDVITTLKSTIPATPAVISQPADTTVDTPRGAADVYQASIRLPYYLSKTKPDSYWKASGPSILAVLSATQDPDGPDLPKVAPLTMPGLIGQVVGCNPSLSASAATAAILAKDITKLVGCDIKYDTGDTAGKSVDSFQHLTRFNPIPVPPLDGANPQIQDITVQITLPKNPALSAPYPVNIAVHGLGTLKETTLANADSLALAGIATIAIDMPLHGSRGFDILNADGAPGQDGVYDISATDKDGALGLQDSGLIANAASYAKGTALSFVYVNSGLTVRDNFRQAISDLLRLRTQIPHFKDPSNQANPLFDTKKVTTHGLSLGAITATSFATYANAGVDDYNNPATPDFNVNKISLVAPTGGLAWVFNESPAFGPLLMDQLVAIVAKEQGIPFALPTDPVHLNAARQSSGYKALEAAADEKIVPSLLFSVQTQVDSIDPINMAETLRTNSVNKIHLIEIVGDGFDGDIQTTNADGLPAYDLNATNKSDQVLPNFGTIPVTGTERLIANLGLVTATGKCINSVGLYPNGGVVRFSQGHHSSLINPSSAAGATDAGALAATTEMQKQVASFAESDLGVSVLTAIKDTCL